MNDGQRAHVKERLAQGASQEEMVHYLMSEGVEEATARQEIAAEATQTAAGTSAGLPTVGNLFADSWSFTKSRLDLVGWYVLISLVPIVLTVTPIALGILLDSVAPAMIWAAVLVGLVAFVFMVWFMVVASAGLFYAVAQAETTRFKEGWQWAHTRFWSIAWIAALLMLVLLPAMIAFVVPALVVMVYTMFYFLCYIQHEHKGLHALAASTQLVYGRFWPIFGRFAFMIAVIMLVSFGITALFALLGSIVSPAETLLVAIGEIVNTIVSFVLTIVTMRYLVLLYSAVTASAATYVEQPLSTSYKLYRVLAWVGAGLLALMPAIFALTMLA